MQDNPPVETEAANEPAVRKTNTPRLLLLLLLLGLMVGALYWDRKVARPASEAQMKTLEELAQQRAASTDPQLTQEDVATTLGRQPTISQDGDLYLIERFKWRAGLPWRSYAINVVYRKTSNGPRFHTAYYMEEPDAELLPGYKPPDVDPSATPGQGDASGIPGGNLTDPPLSGEGLPSKGEDAGAPKAEDAPKGEGASKGSPNGEGDDASSSN